MGGSGGGSYTEWSSDSLKRAVRDNEQKSAADFEIRLASYLGELLSAYNSRDTDLVRRRIDDAKAGLQDSLETTLEQIFGGSVAKHTYVDGLSDIDSLLIVNGSKFEDLNPATILRRMDDILRQSLGPKVGVEHGHMAVTLSYPDGMNIQLLPAIRTGEGLKIPAAPHTGWSEINPEAFRSALVRRNDECGGKLVPTIKLAKAVIANMPEAYRVTGYHVESMAIAAFRGYEGTKITAAMLPYFFGRACELVLSPIRDRTGQSVHVDGYLGDANSEQRQYISRWLGNVAKRMTNASAAQSNAQWEALFSGE
jgi:hypothetical protein